MFGPSNKGTVIAKGLKIVGTVTAEGLIQVNGEVDGELHCTSLIISRGSQVSGTIAAGRIVVDGSVAGPIKGGEVTLKSQAHVVGDIHHRTLAIEKGAYFDGRSVQIGTNHEEPDIVRQKQRSEARETPASRIERAAPIDDPPLF